MSESSTSLAIIESKLQIKRSGGCVGIFFQLFDWNKRFSKKKLMPKKLLPQVPAKMSKKFNVGEKLTGSRHLLIVDENCGGFPSKMKKNGELKLSVDNKKNEMKAPGLVARLMGLEVMPFKDDKCGVNSSKAGFVGRSPNYECEFGCIDSSPEKGNVRPQKVQRTGVVERKPIARFGVEALHIKNILMRSRKNRDQTNAVPSVKSPKMRRNGLRLIDAAARILEPGIQATSRARCSLSYPSSGNVCVQNQCGFVLSEVQVPTVEGACHSCGNVYGGVDVTSVVEESSRDFDEVGSDFRERFFCDFEGSRSRPVVYLENENDVVLLKTRCQSEHTAPQPEDSRPGLNAPARNGMRPSEDHDLIPMSRVFTSQRGAQCSDGLKHRLRRPGQMLVGDRIPPKSKSANSPCRRGSSPGNAATDAKDFIAINRNISQSRPQAPIRPDNSFEVNKRFQTGKNDPLASQRKPVRKRRTPVAISQSENAASAGSPFERQRSNKGNVVMRGGPQVHATSVNQSGFQSRPASRRAKMDSIRTDVVSFTFNSPVKSSGVTKSHNEIGAGRRDPVCSVDEKTVQQQHLMEENDSEQPSRSHLCNEGDALGFLLEEKLKELTKQAENEGATGFLPSTRTTASILQELISALTAERPVSSEGSDLRPERRDSEFSEVSDNISPANSKSKSSSTGHFHDVDQFSPGCVLDASFSPESCVSSTFDDVSVKLALTNADFKDSASSTIKAQVADITVVTDLVNHTSTLLQNVNCVHGKFTSTKRDHIQEILLNAELLFGKDGLHSSSRFVDFLLGPFLDELEALVLAAWKNSIILGIEVRKEDNPLRRFLIDCLIECLDVKYSRFINCGFRAWSRLPKSIDAEVLIKVFDDEVRKWISFGGKTTDEMIEREMSSSFGRWTDFEIEAFETGEQINQDIVQNLVDEVVTDLFDSELSFRPSHGQRLPVNMSPVVKLMYKLVN